MQNHQQNYSKKNINKSSGWRSIFLKNSGGISSKRIIAVIGCFICFGLLIAAFIFNKDVPEFGEVIFIGCISLYGVEVIPNFWSKTINKS